MAMLQTSPRPSQSSAISFCPARLYHHPWARTTPRQQCPTMSLFDQQPLASAAITDRRSRRSPEEGSRNASSAMALFP
eukprot:575694-Pyramimonas_sp.AAC.1